MKTINWQSKSLLVKHAIETNETFNNLNGGNQYDVQVYKVLEKANKMSICEKTIFKKNQSFLTYILNVFFQKVNAEIIIREPFPIAFGNYKRRIKYIGIIHHLDNEQQHKNLKNKIFFWLLFKRLNKLDKIVTVSKYSQKIIQTYYNKNIEIIYNSFDVKEYNATISAADFKEKHNIPVEKILIYIGNPKKEKGIYSIYEALQNKNYELISSGLENQASELPIRFFTFEKKQDYINMLSSCDLTICFSEMIEGWNRIAHESLLCKTPVIGNGSGGMEELLIKSSQLICKNRNDLPRTIDQLMKNRTYYTQKAYECVKQWDNSYFENKWNELIEKIR